MFGCLLLRNDNHILCSQFCGSPVLAGHSPDGLFLLHKILDPRLGWFEQLEMSESPTGVIYIWGLSKAVGWLLRFFFMSSLLGLQCPPRRLHSHICLRRLEQLGGRPALLSPRSLQMRPSSREVSGWLTSYLQDSSEPQE